MNADGNLLASRFLTEEVQENLVELVAGEISGRWGRATGWRVTEAMKDAETENVRIALARLLARAGRMSGDFETTYTSRGMCRGGPCQLDVRTCEGRPGKLENRPVCKFSRGRGFEACLVSW